MKHSYFEIKNFRGINRVRLDLLSTPKSKVYTLVGLNESGKTTILDAINSTNFNTERLDPLALPGYSSLDPHDLIPKGKKSNFNGTITIEVGYDFDEKDKQKVREFLLEQFNFELAEEINSFNITKSYEFRDSTLLAGQPKNFWSLASFSGRRGLPGKRRKSKLIKQIKAQGETREEWIKTVNYVETLLPSVLYFPNFLFEFPDRIYLEDKPSEAKLNIEKHRFYRTVLQDVLDAIGEGANIKKHILERAKSGARHDKQALESVLLSMESHITKTVFSNWNRIFNRNIGNKQIVVNCEEDEDNHWFLQLRLRESNQVYEISERSLGFRWFFSFLLFTQYRGFRKDAPKNVLFLLDEPASNLHPSAQRQLLKSFDKLENCSIIYTTHSHHMVNAAWLENTYVVKNEGIDYETEDEYVATNTVVTLEKYRSFAANHPNQTTYFQPILDVLDYKIGELENVPNVIMVEGKNDFYTLRYVHDILLNGTEELKFMPGAGAGKLDDVIRLYIAWGRKFIILLDSDEGGIKEKERYKNLFGSLIDNHIFSLGDINVLWKNKSLEFLFEESDRIAIQTTGFPSTVKYNKTHFNRSVQEMLLMKQHIHVAETSKTNFKTVLNFLKEKLET